MNTTSPDHQSTSGSTSPTIQRHQHQPSQTSVFLQQPSPSSPLSPSSSFISLASGPSPPHSPATANPTGTTTTTIETTTTRPRTYSSSSSRSGRTKITALPSISQDLNLLPYMTPDRCAVVVARTSSRWDEKVREEMLFDSLSKDNPSPTAVTTSAPMLANTRLSPASRSTSSPSKLHLTTSTSTSTPTARTQTSSHLRAQSHSHPSQYQQHQYDGCKNPRRTSGHCYARSGFAFGFTPLAKTAVSGGGGVADEPVSEGSDPSEGEYAHRRKSDASTMSSSSANSVGRSGRRIIFSVGGPEEDEDVFEDGYGGEEE
ncbi:uncharacterized protein EI90DRAFT_3049577 [Cantharellus anzutake]|uniref:uncharacterized protein n=1 Tax=Cantharellus anzutake TaxID=1750568 RepID=UPI0019049627|nr:uncharacterized protein EI90DRAFT_3049577 [Cantharellus anzutake]KAF8334623.1 hypothetical protein EI90DRAFT_3049577 [Cantharellus anzutake]